MGTELQEENFLNHGNSFVQGQHYLYYRAECFASLGMKKQARKCITLYKRYTPKAHHRNVRGLEEEIARLPVFPSPRQDPVPVRMKCSNPLCLKVETRPKEFNMCVACKAAKYCSRKCQKVHWKNGHKKF